MLNVELSWAGKFMTKLKQCFLVCPILCYIGKDQVCIWGRQELTYLRGYKKLEVENNGGGGKQM